MDMTLPQQSQEQTDYVANWPMPAVEVGDAIVWLSDYKNPNSKCAGTVTRVSLRSIECTAIMGDHAAMHLDVLHKDDPRLHVNTHMRQNGSWDYSPLTAKVIKLEADQLQMKDLLADILGDDDFEFEPDDFAIDPEEIEQRRLEQIEKTRLAGEKIKAGLAKRKENKEKMRVRMENMRAKREANRVAKLNQEVPELQEVPS